MKKGKWGQKWLILVSYCCVTNHPKTQWLKALSIFMIAHNITGSLGGSSGLRWALAYVCGQVWVGLVALPILAGTHMFWGWLTLGLSKMAVKGEKWALLKVFSRVPAREARFVLKVVGLWETVEGHKDARLRTGTLILLHHSAGQSKSPSHIQGAGKTDSTSL